MAKTNVTGDLIVLFKLPEMIPRGGFVYIESDRATTNFEFFIVRTLSKNWYEYKN